MTENSDDVTTTRNVVVGVDTHRDFHVAAIVDTMGRELDTRSFPATGAGYRHLTSWAGRYGTITTVGVEGTGSWGAGLTRYVTSTGLCCVEVNRPNRQHRRRHGKSDTADAVGAARAVLAGTATATPKTGDGPVESLRVVRVGHRSAIKARTQAINQLKALIVTSPEPLQARLTGLSRSELIDTCQRFRPGAETDPLATTKGVLRSLAKRINHLTDEIETLEVTRQQLVTACAPPELLIEHGIGPAVATDLLIAFGDNPERVVTEAAFAALCGVSPVDCSSGRQQRHRLNRGGDRQANNALWRIVMVRLSNHQQTRDYYQRSLANGKTKRETIRTLKRYTARRIWRLLKQHPPKT